MAQVNDSTNESGPAARLAVLAQRISAVPAGRVSDDDAEFALTHRRVEFAPPKAIPPGFSHYGNAARMYAPLVVARVVDVAHANARRDAQERSRERLEQQHRTYRINADLLSLLVDD